MPSGENTISDPAAGGSEWEERDPPRAVPAWLLSLALHFAAVGSLIWLGRTTPPGGGEPVRTAGIVLVSAASGPPNAFSTDPTPSSQQTASGQPAVEPLPADAALPPVLDGALPQAESLAGGGLGEDSLPTDAGGVPQNGRPSTSISAASGSTRVFGIDGSGSKFVYVFDRSSSMNGYQGRPLRAAKSELIRSLQSLEKNHQFQVIFYNERPDVLNPFRPAPPRLLFGDARGKLQAERFIRGISAQGGTRHFEPLRAALRMGPDVVFFLTDALDPPLSGAELAKLARINQTVGAAIHTIEFGVGPPHGGPNFLRRLAHQNGGRYAYVDVTRLP